MSRILIIDDEPAIGWTLGELLTDEGHSVAVAGSVEAAVEALATFTPDDFGRGPLDGIAFQREQERRFFEAGGGSYAAPAQRVHDST